MADVTITLEELGPLYASSVEKKHNWDQFLKAVQAKHKGIEAKTVKSKLNYAKQNGLKIVDFPGQSNGAGRGKPSKDYNEVAGLFGVKFDKALYEKNKAKAKADALKRAEKKAKKE